MHNLEGKLTWRKSTRKVASEYNMLPAGVLESDYDINVADVPDSVVIAMLQKQINHIYNNESISGCVRLKEKAKETPGTIFDQVAWIHADRLARKAGILDGTYGTTRAASAPLVVDPIVVKMQEEAHRRLVVIATKKGRTDFPSTYTTETAKIVLFPKSGTTLAQLVANMIEGDASIRAWATKEVEREEAEKKARLEALAAEDTDDQAESVWEEDEAA